MQIRMKIKCRNTGKTLCGRTYHHRLQAADKGTESRSFLHQSTSTSQLFRFLKHVSLIFQIVHNIVECNLCFWFSWSHKYNNIMYYIGLWVWYDYAITYANIAYLANFLMRCIFSRFSAYAISLFHHIYSTFFYFPNLCIDLQGISAWFFAHQLLLPKIPVISANMRGKIGA